MPGNPPGDIAARLAASIHPDKLCDANRSMRCPINLIFMDRATARLYVLTIDSVWKRQTFTIQ